MLGFYPQDCLLVLPFYQEERTYFPCVIREDLVNLTSETVQPERLLATMAGRGWQAASLMVIAGGTRAGSDHPPHADLVGELDGAFRRNGIHVPFSLWVPRIEQGALWLRYCEHSPQSGRQKDPRDCPTAATATAMGKVIYERVEDFTDSLTPDKEAARRERRMLYTLLERSQDTEISQNGKILSRKVHRVLEAVEAAEHEKFPTTDRELVSLAWALEDPLIRDSSYRFAFIEPAHAAIRLWQHLTRALPGKHRADAATLLAVTAALRGNTELARLAAQTAVTADPDRASEPELAEILPYGVISSTRMATVGFATTMAVAKIGLSVADTRR
ncbi:DUF4192 domain-containing protein [Crossiella sp. S99.2]|nr:DUF4192 domain-containing protein [Crossiella sp. S99.2]MCK2253942.1 DUF4192 domain-containing protein [Crossiella sp. S99.1]